MKVIKVIINYIYLELQCNANINKKVSETKEIIDKLIAVKSIIAIYDWLLKVQTHFTIYSRDLGLGYSPLHAGIIMT